MTKDNGVICAAPWVHLYIHPDGEVNPCCTAIGVSYGNTNKMTVDQAWRSDTAKKFRKDLLDGIPQEACNFCYNQEKFKSGSLRTRLNYYYGDLISDSLEPDFKLKYLDIRSSNICNMACVMCSHSLSSSWYEDGVALDYGVEENSSKFITLSNDTEKDILKIIDNNLKVVYFAGGEPLITPYHYTLVQELIDRGLAHKIRLEYSTNLSTLKYKKINIIDLWRQFESVEIRASIDASGDIAEYQRYGTDWQQILENWNTIKTQMPEVNLATQITVTSLNIGHLPKFLDQLVDYLGVDPFVYLKDGGDQFIVNLASGPKIFSCINLPNDIKKMYTDEIKKYTESLRPGDERIRVLESSTHFMNSQEPDLFHFLDKLKFLTKLDGRRNTDWKQLWPEFVKYYEEKN